MSSLLAVVSNYDFSTNADSLKKFFSGHFDTILIDSSSPRQPDLVDVTIPNWHYSGLWNEAVRQTRRRHCNWLLFCASDVTLVTPSAILDGIAEATALDDVGVYTPALQNGSRAFFKDCIQRNTRAMRSCRVVEGFFFVARMAILEKIYPIDVERHTYGWGIDTMTAYQAVRDGYNVVVDDRCTIYHPESTHEIDKEAAYREFMSYFDDTELKAFVEAVQQTNNSHGEDTAEDGRGRIRCKLLGAGSDTPGENPGD